MAVIPTRPTDNLYKFLALFGLVLLVFAMFFPEEKLARPLAQVQEANKARQVAKIRITRKNVELREAFEQIQAKIAEQNKNKEQLDDAVAKLNAKGDSLVKSLVEQAKHDLKSKAVKDLYAQTKALDPEYQDLGEKVRQNTEAIRKNTEDLQKLRPRYAELSDDIAVEEVNVKAFGEAINELNFQINLWYTLAIVCVIVGFLMMLFGFQLWYKRVQIHQDAILRKQACDIKELADKRG